jgi:hypothetical protein
MVEVVSVGYLRRATVSAPIMSNDSKAFAQEEKHLRVPIVRAQWPAVTEYYGLTCAPVFVVDVDVCSVFFSDGYIWHKQLLSVQVALDDARHPWRNPTPENLRPAENLVSMLRFCHCRQAMI